MGWTFNTAPGGFKKMIAECSQNHETDNRKVECLKKKFIGNIAYKGNLWMLFQETDKETGEQKRYIVLCLMECRGGCWGYKDISDSMGPCETNCPLSYVEACTPTESVWANEWREKVRKFHAGMPKKGKKYKVRHEWIKNITITKLRPLMGKTDAGHEIKIHWTRVGEEIVEEKKAVA